MCVGGSTPEPFLVAMCVSLIGLAYISKSPFSNRIVGISWLQVVVMRPETNGRADSDLEDDVDEDEQERRPKRFEFVAHVPLPDEKEIERMVVEKKKLELLSKYASDDLVKEELEAKEMLNIRR